VPRSGLARALHTIRRLGVQLRAEGFRGLRVEIQAPDGGGHTLRILSLDRPGELLVEVRLSRSRSAIPGMEVIALEWMLLQNPRARFSERRSRLPGQKHPGLGLLRDIIGWLFVVCESHQLDGIYFVAAHYHVAMQSRRVLRFWMVLPVSPRLKAEVEGPERERKVAEALGRFRFRPLIPVAYR